MASNFCFLSTELCCDASLHRVPIISNPGLGHGRSRGKEKTWRACNLDGPRIPAGRCWRRSVDDKPLYCSLYLDAPSSSSSSSQTVGVELDSLFSAPSRVLYDPALCESRRRGERLGVCQRGQRRLGSLCSLREHAEHPGGSGHLSQCSVSDARGEVLNAPLHDGSSRRQRHNFEEKGLEQEEDLVTEGEESNALVTFEETEGDLEIDVENSLVSGSILPVEVDRLEPSDDTVRCGETSGQKDGKHEEGIRDSSVGVKRESSRDVENLKVNGATGLLHRKKEESKVVRTAWEKLVRWSRSWQLLNAGKSSNALASTKKVVVLGGGSFGTAMAVLLARNKAEMNVILLLRDAVVCQTINEHHLNLKYFPNHQLPKNVGATTNAKEALKDAQFCVHAVPVQSSSAFLRSIAEHVPATLPFLSVSKGLELSTLEMMSQVIPRSLGNPRQPVAVISGPSFAIELMDELPTGMVAASRDKALALSAQQLLASRYLRVNTSNDVIGVEMAGALKNVLAIAAGIVEGMQLGNNCMAALVAQGCSEIRWLAEKMGAKSTTLSGLSGSGDIMLTCFVTLSRNRSVGVRLGSGEKLEDILSSMKQVAEGVATAGAVISLAKKYRVQMPVLTAVARILDNELTPKTAVLALMSLPQVEEV